MPEIAAKSHKDSDPIVPRYDTLPDIYDISCDEFGKLRGRNDVFDTSGLTSVVIGTGANSVQSSSSGIPATLNAAWTNGAASALVGQTLILTIGGVTCTVTFTAGNCANQAAILTACNGATPTGFGAGTTSVNNSGALVIQTTATLVVGQGSANVLMGMIGPAGLIGTAASTTILGRSAAQYATDKWPGFQPRTAQILGLTAAQTNAGLNQAIPVFRQITSVSGGTAYLLNPGAMPYQASASTTGPVILNLVTIPSNGVWPESCAVVVPNSSTDLVGWF